MSRFEVKSVFGIAVKGTVYGKGETFEADKKAMEKHLTRGNVVELKELKEPKSTKELKQEIKTK